jgi:hypothetical protein
MLNQASWISNIIGKIRQIKKIAGGLSYERTVMAGYPARRTTTTEWTQVHTV